MSAETILSAYTHNHIQHTRTQRHPHTHEHTDYTKLNSRNLKQAANRDSRRMKTAAWKGKHGRSIVWGKRNVFKIPGYT